MLSHSFQVCVLILSFVLLSFSHEVRSTLSQLQSDIHGRSTLVNDVSTIRAREPKKGRHGKQGKGGKKGQAGPPPKKEDPFFEYVTVCLLFYLTNDLANY